MVSLKILRRAIAVGVMFELLLVVAAANLFGDQPDLLIPWAVMVLTVTGAIGGLFGQLDALMKAFFRSLR